MAASAPLGPETLEFLRACRTQINALLEVPKICGRGPINASLKKRGFELNDLRVKIARGTFSAADRCRIFDIHHDVCQFAETIAKKVKEGLYTPL